MGAGRLPNDERTSREGQAARRCPDQHKSRRVQVSEPARSSIDSVDQSLAGALSAERVRCPIGSEVDHPFATKLTTQLDRKLTTPVWW
jgi:hypothetical protein